MVTMTAARLVSCTFATPLGEMVAAAAGDGLCLLEFNDRRALAAERADLERRLGGAIADGNNEHLERMGAELAGYFAGRVREFTVPLVLPGTPFECAVWERLRAIPYGRTVSYEDIAVELGKPGAQRAVGRANGRNRVAIVVPCHRVIEKGGGLRGYGGGVHRKAFLLDLERRGAGEPTLW